MWTNDSKRILLEHFDIIHNSPSHLYHSALPFFPSTSWFHECYSSELSQEAKVVKGLLAEWGMCSCTVLLNNSPCALSYWNNAMQLDLHTETYSNLILVWYEHRQINIWHAEKGELLKAINCLGVVFRTSGYQGMGLRFSACMRNPFKHGVFGQEKLWVRCRLGMQKKSL